MGFSVFKKAHTSPPYGFLPSADIGQAVYYFCNHRDSYLLCEQHMRLFDTTVGTIPGPRFSGTAKPSTLKGGPRKVPTVVSKSRIRCWHNIYNNYDKVPETSLLFSLFCTVFATWKHLEAFGYWLFSLQYFAPLFWHWKDKQAKTVKLPNGSNNKAKIVSIQMLPNSENSTK